MSAIPNYLQQAWRLSEKELDDVEVVVDLRDCITDPDLARASTASSGSEPSRALRALRRGDQTPSSASHLSDELDIESVLRALTSEVTGVDEADDLFPSLRLHQLEARQDPGLASSWLDGISRRSSAMSVHSEEMSVTFPCSPSETASGQGEASESPSQADADFELQEEILQSVAEDQATQPGTILEAEPADVTEDMISVVDIGDDVIPSADDSSLVHGPSYSSPRPLETTVASLLRRLSLEHQVDDSVASSIRGVLEVSELLAEVEASPLTEEEIHALPSFPYVPCKESQQCAICLDPFQEREEVTMLRCAHFFHTECVASWMHRAAKCPLCRAYVVE